MIYSIYLVTFNKYDNPEKSSVSCLLGSKLMTNHRGEYLTTEENLPNINKYGNGIKNQKFVGFLKPNPSKENYVILNEDSFEQKNSMPGFFK
jgi:hypothetical protein